MNSFLKQGMPNKEIQRKPPSASRAHKGKSEMMMVWAGAKEDQRHAETIGE